MTNSFLYFRDIRNNPKSQSADTFSDPYDQQFYQKFTKYLKQQQTESCYNEMFRQFNAHALNPLSAADFLGDAVAVVQFCNFYKNNEKWRGQMSQGIINLFENRNGLLFHQCQQSIKETVIDLILNYFIMQPELLVALDQIMQDQKMIDQNEPTKLEKFRSYLQSSLSNKKLLSNVGNLCSCLSSMTLKNQSLQAQTLQLLHDFVLKVLQKDINDEQTILTLQFVRTCIIQDSKCCCYLVDDSFTKSLLKLLDKYNEQIQIITLDIISIMIQHYPQCLREFESSLIKISQYALNLVSENDDLNKEIALHIQRMMDGPLRTSSVFEEVISKLLAQGAWGEGVDGTYEAIMQ